MCGCVVDFEALQAAFGALLAIQQLLVKTDKEPCLSGDQLRREYGGGPGRVDTQSKDHLLLSV